MSSQRKIGDRTGVLLRIKCIRRDMKRRGTDGLIDHVTDLGLTDLAEQADPDLAVTAIEMDPRPEWLKRQIGPRLDYTQRYCQPANQNPSNETGENRDA